MTDPADLGEAFPRSPAPPETVAVAAPKPKLGLDVCQLEFERICQAYRISTTPEGLNSDELGTFEELRTHICDAISEGMITVDVNGCPTVKTRDGKPLVFRKATTLTLLAGDGLQPFQFTRRALLIGTELTGSDKDRLSKLDIDEFRTVTDLVNLVLLRR